MIAAVYARYSSGQDREQSSTIEAQIAMCKEKALANGWEVDSDHIYICRQSHIGCYGQSSRLSGDVDGY